MARNTFNYEKRQKELAKKKKQEAKRARRVERTESGAEGGPPIASSVNEFGEVLDDGSKNASASDD